MTTAWESIQGLHNISEFKGTRIERCVAECIVHLHDGKSGADGKFDEGIVFPLPRKERAK